MSNSEIIRLSLGQFVNNISIINRVLYKLIQQIKDVIKDIKANIKANIKGEQLYYNNFDDKSWFKRLQEIPDYLDTVEILKEIRPSTRILILKYISDARNIVNSCKLYLEYYLLNKTYLVKSSEYYKKLLDNANLRLYANLDDLGKPNFKTHYDNLSAFYKKEGLKKMVKEFENQHDINFII